MTAPKLVYLAGAIQGKTDAECRGWRDELTSKLPAGWKALDPMDRDYRGVSIDVRVAREIVEGDLDAIDSCHVMIAMADNPSWGTAMEIFYASRWRATRSPKRVILICPRYPKPISPWLLHHCSAIVHTVDEAVSLLK